MPTQPKTDALRAHLDKTGTDVRQWSPEERQQHSQLSDAAMREQANAPK